jgi:hypothetical protein
MRSKSLLVKLQWLSQRAPQWQLAATACLTLRGLPQRLQLQVLGRSIY